MAAALRVFQEIGRGVNRVGLLVKPSLFFCHQTAAPMRFELEAVLDHRLYRYHLALELPNDFKELRVLEERLECEGQTVFVRQQAQVSVRKARSSQYSSEDARFMVDWHLVALPLIQVQSDQDPIHIFKTWLGHMVVIAPVPSLMNDESSEESLWPLWDASNTVDWLSGLLGQYPAAYAVISDYLKEVMPDLKAFKFETLGKESKRLVVQFQSDKHMLPLHFDQLSDGEKCFFRNYSAPPW